MLSTDGKLKLKSLLVDHEKNINFEADYIYFYNKLNNFLLFFHKLDENRKIALLYSCFFIGVQGLIHSKEFLEAMHKSRYKEAAEEIAKISDAIMASSYIIKTGEI